MNDAEFETQKARVMALDEQWTSTLGLDAWDISHCWHRGAIDDCDEGAFQALACCETHWQYLHAMIHWNLTQVGDQTDKELETAFVHECMHIFLGEVRGEPDDWLDHEERVAQMLAKAFVWVRNAERAAHESEVAQVVLSDSSLLPRTETSGAPALVRVAGSPRGCSCSGAE